MHLSASLGALVLYCISSATTMDLSQISKRLGIEEDDIPDFLSAAAIHAYQKYQNAGDRASIDLAVHYAKLSIYVTLEEPHEAGRLNTLGIMLGRR